MNDKVLIGLVLILVLIEGIRLISFLFTDLEDSLYHRQINNRSSIRDIQLLLNMSEAKNQPRYDHRDGRRPNLAKELQKLKGIVAELTDDYYGE